MPARPGPATTSAAAAEPCPTRAPPRSPPPRSPPVWWPAPTAGSWRSSSRRRHRAASAAAHGCSPAPSTPAPTWTPCARPSARPGRTVCPPAPTARRGVTVTPVPRDRPGTHSWRTRSRTPRRGGCVSTTRGSSRSRWPCPTWRCATRHWPAAPGRTRTEPSTCGPRSSGRRRIRRLPSPRRCSPRARCCAVTERWPGSRWTGRSRRGPGHRLTGLLRAVWAAGMPPERVRDCFCPPPAAAMPVRRVAGRSKRRSRR